MISTLDHTDTEQSEAIRTVMAASYAIEGDLIGATDFPPLRRTSEDIRSTLATFHGFTVDGDLVAVAEIEKSENGGVHIGGFVVHPKAFRRGIGSRLLTHVLEASGDLRITVSTAALNQPAILMYEKHGFKISKYWVIQDIEMVTLETRAICPSVRS